MKYKRNRSKAGVYIIFLLIAIGFSIFVYLKTKSYIFALIAIAASVALIFLAKLFSSKSIRRRCEPTDYITQKYFEDHWIEEGHKKEGYKYDDRPGCYVILVFNRPVKKRNFEGYENVYIGQSVNVHQRVHNHFTGHGNGDVYADKKNGKILYVRFVYSDRYSLNENEIRLIDLYNAQESYNRTAGGAKITE